MEIAKEHGHEEERTKKYIYNKYAYANQEGHIYMTREDVTSRCDGMDGLVGFVWTLRTPGWGFDAM